MKVLYSDLISFLDEKPSLEILSNRLFQLGHEHEINSEIFNFELTPNRGDCLSLYGLARDLNVFFGSSNHLVFHNDDIEELNLDFVNLSFDACPRISFLEIEIYDTVSEYKPYLDNYFSSLGHNKINFFTDISNYVSYELGQPSHCYDRNRIKNSLIFENKVCNEEFQTLTDTSINLRDVNCVFTMNDKIINLGGVMGGMATACTNKTKKALVEFAYFNPELIIGKTIKYNLNSDAAHRFERGVDFSAQEKAIRRFIQIVKEHTPIKSLKVDFDYNYHPNRLKIPVDVDKINNILGTNLNKETYLDYMKKLSFIVTSDNIEIPFHRHDINTQNDIAEEVARVIGYDNIESRPINLNKSNSDNKDISQILETYFYEKGFTEVINYPFSSNINNSSVIVDNPLDSNRLSLRTSIKDSLIENLLYNERRQKDSIKLFEISDIYTKSNDSINQEKKIGLIVSGRVGYNFKEFSKKINIKYLEEILDNFDGNFSIEEIRRDKLNSKRKDLIYYAEAKLDEIYLNPSKAIKLFKSDFDFIKYKPISDYPSSIRDFSFLIENLSKFEEFTETLEKISDNIIKEIFIFDFYKNNKTNSIKVGYRFVFQSQIKTLSDEEVNRKVEEIITPILGIDGISIPGM